MQKKSNAPVKSSSSIKTSGPEVANLLIDLTLRAAIRPPAILTEQQTNELFESLGYTEEMYDDLYEVDQDVLLLVYLYLKKIISEQTLHDLMKGKEYLFLTSKKNEDILKEKLGIVLTQKSKALKQLDMDIELVKDEEDSSTDDDEDEEDSSIDDEDIDDENEDIDEEAE